MTSRRGITLVEVLVAGGLFLLLLGILIAFIHSALRTWARSDVKAQVQQSAMVVTSLLMQEFRHSHAESVYIKKVEATEDELTVHQDAILFVSALDDRGRVRCDPLGNLIWQRSTVIYHDGRGQVLWQQTPLAPPGTTPDPVRITSYTPSPRDHVVARLVRSLQLRYDDKSKLQIAVETALEGQRSTLETSVQRLTDVTLAGVTGASPTP